MNSFHRENYNSPGIFEIGDFYDFGNMCQIFAVCQILAICLRFCLKLCLDGLKINPGEYQNRVQRPRKPPVGFVLKGF